MLFGADVVSLVQGMITIRDLNLVCSKEGLALFPKGKVLINTINAYSFVKARQDDAFAEVLMKCDFLIPDGAGIVKACRFLKAKCQPKERITGRDLFYYEMSVLNERGGRVMFVGSTEGVLEKIKCKAKVVFPKVEVLTLSPPYSKCFSASESEMMVSAINAAQPDLLWIGMTAPKQEKWVYEHWNELDVLCHVGTIGAVFDFFAGTSRRAPQWWQKHSLEWLYRFIQEPQRMWRRYLVGNVWFLFYLLEEKMK